jgi:glycosyltransferase involved in cell wall biosynthesis
MRTPCSVPILTLNARHHLERLLPVLTEAFDDVLIIDGNSTDGTVEYARSLGVRVERQFDHNAPNTRIEDFTQARERSFGFARHDWIFLVDADEYPSPELIQTVRTIVEQNERTAAHTFPRVAVLPDGRVVDRAFFYPEYTMTRLFHRASGVALAHARRVHERFVLPQGMREVRHAEPFRHVWPDADTFRRKMAHYVSLEYSDWQNVGVWHRLQWAVWYNLRSALGQTARALWCWMTGTVRGQTVLPWIYTWPMITYRFKAMKRGFSKSQS